MTDKEFERIISFIVNENVIRRLLNSADLSDKSIELGGAQRRDDVQNIHIAKFFN
ncbi:MAG: hypothetical protein ACRD47_00250 [Nitrososphaeraceae archaeon]|jgi:hypothetical protein